MVHWIVLIVLKKFPRCEVYNTWRTASLIVPVFHNALFHYKMFLCCKYFVNIIQNSTEYYNGRTFFRWCSRQKNLVPITLIRLLFLMMRHFVTFTSGIFFYVLRLVITFTLGMFVLWWDISLLLHMGYFLQYFMKHFLTSFIKGMFSL